MGLLQGPDERQPPLTLPEVRDEEQEEDRDPYSTWQALHGNKTLKNTLSK